MEGWELETLTAQFGEKLYGAVSNPAVRTGPVPPSTVGKPRASVIGAGCLRQVQYQTWAIPQTNSSDTPEAQLPSKIGLALEPLVLRFMQGAGATLLTGTLQPSVSSELPWTATPDFLIEFQGAPMLVQVKWMGYLRYLDLIKQGSVLKAHAPYYWQICAELANTPEVEAGWLLAFPFDGGAVRGKTRFAKDAPVVPPFYVELIQRNEESQEVLEQIAGVVSATHPDDSLLPRGFNIEKDWQCRYCSWRERCGADGEY